MGAFRRRLPQLLAGAACALILTAAAAVPAAFAEEPEYSGIAWSFDTETLCFALENTESVCPAGQELRCVAALYLGNGQLLSRGMAERKADGTVSVICDPCELPADYRISFLFLNEYNRPVSPALTYEVTTTAPSCEKAGAVTAMSVDGTSSQTLQILPAEGHDYSEAQVQKPTDEVNCGFSTRQCGKCFHTETTPIYPECSIARLCMYGDLTGIGKKAEVPITVSFDGQGKQVDCYALLKYQGHTSLVYDKKNYTLKLFKDADHKEKNKLTFFDWNKEHKYILKANYVDASACRNLVCADLWGEMVASREDYHPRLDDCSNYGATDGFPLALYLNDEFQGLYTFTLHRDDDLFDMEDGNLDAILVANTAQTDAAFFKAPATFEDNSDWEVEYSGLEDDTLWAEQKLNDLIAFVRTASDEEFRANLGEYLDVNSALDNLIAIYALGLTNSGAKNMTLAAYDNGTLFCSLCDMENAFGLSPTGETVYLPTEYLPACTDGAWDSATNSLLWDRILQLYQPELCARYTALRRSILTAERISGKAKAFMEPIADAFYAADKTLYPDMPQLKIAPGEQIEAYTTERLTLLDELFLIEHSDATAGEGIVL